MSKDYFVLKEGVNDYPYGFYERETAETYAKGSARNNPGVTYTVVHRLAEYQHATDAKR